jgi:hypothetical protein
MRTFLGRGSEEVYDALRQRIDRSVGRTGHLDPAWTPDVVDRAALGCLARAALACHDPEDFEIITKSTFSDLAALVATVPDRIAPAKPKERLDDTVAYDSIAFAGFTAMSPTDAPSPAELEAYREVLTVAATAHPLPNPLTALGDETQPIYQALRHRLGDEPDGEPATDHVPDAVDWAAVRAIVAPLLARADWRVSGKGIDQPREVLLSLNAKAIAAIRRHRTMRAASSYQIGDCRVTFPSDHVRDGRYVIVVPDADSWDHVVPSCAIGRRDEFMSAFVEAATWRSEEDEFVELAARTSADLEAWMERHRKPVR